MSEKKKIICKICRRKITLTYIECRCLELFCGSHIYADSHNCTYDHKKFHMENIRNNNPIIKKDKFEKI